MLAKAQRNKEKINKYNEPIFFKKFFLPPKLDFTVSLIKFYK